MDFLEVGEEEEAVPRHQLLIHQHHDRSKTGRQVEKHVDSRYCDDGDGCAALVAATCARVGRDACGGRLDGEEHGPGGDDAGESDGEDGKEDRDDDEESVKKVGSRDGGGNVVDVPRTSIITSGRRKTSKTSTLFHGVITLQ